MLQDPIALIDSINTAPPTVCVLYGDEPQLIEEVRAAVKTATASATAERADLETLPASPIMQERGAGLFGNGSCRYEIVGHSAPLADSQAALLKITKRVEPPDTLLIALYHLERKHHKAAWLRQVTAQGVSVCAERLNAAQTSVWCRRWAKEWELAIDEQTIQWLATHTEGNLAATKQCLQKMRLGDSTPDLQQAQNALSDGARYNAFNLADTALKGEGRKALDILRVLLETQEAPPLILWALTNAVQSLMAVKQGGAPAWGLPRQMIYDVARRANEDEIIHLLRRAAAADRVIKGVGGSDVKTALMDITVGLAALKRGIKISIPDLAVL